MMPVRGRASAPTDAIAGPGTLGYGPALMPSWIESLAPRIQATSLRLLRPAVAALAVAALLTYLAVGVVHLRYPFELEWIEGGLVDEVERLAHGGKLYVKPSLDYVPFIYAPLWFHVAALSSKVFGAGFFSARLVSFLSSIGALALIFRIVHKETRAVVPALAAAGAYAATYPVAASFYDLAHVDSLFIVLLLGGLYLARFHVTTAATVASAALFALAFLTKQSGPGVFVPVALHLLLVDRRRGLIFAAVGAALMVGSVLAYNHASDGWFWHYVFELPAKHERVKRVLWDFWFEDLMLRFAVPTLFSLFYLVVEEGSETKRFYFFAAAGMLVTALAGRMHLGGWSNVLAPAFAILAILFGVGLGRVLDTTARLPEGGGQRLALFALAAAAIQLAGMLYNPRPVLPTAENRRAWEGLVSTLEGIDGDVFVSAHGFVGPRAGKRPHAHQMAISDELRSGSDAGNDLRKEIRRSLASKRWPAMVLDNDWLPKEQREAGYEKQSDLPKEGLAQIIGYKTQPSTVFKARP
jgi:4-amino-4-deoxy-L-arabinose transferase-like glycosyltransferase